MSYIIEKTSLNNMKKLVLFKDGEIVLSQIIPIELDYEINSGNISLDHMMDILISQYEASCRTNNYINELI